MLGGRVPPGSFGGWVRRRWIATFWARLIAQLDAEAVRHAPLLVLISSLKDIILLHR